jgi:hypothetical protein
MMKVTEMLLAQLEREIDATRKTVERVPEPVPSIYGPTADEGWQQS